MDPMAILPPEIWEIIFANVEEAQDWLNLYHASPCFQGIVRKQRITSLFPLVLPLLRPYLMYRYLSPAVRTLRLVSKSWNCSVDAVLEGLDLNEKNYRCNRHYDFWRMSPLSTFLNNFSAHPGRNPIIGRSVRFSYSRGRDPQRILGSRALVSRAMTTFGVHIRKLTIVDFTSADTALDNVVLRLRVVVTAAPALESLSFSCTNNSNIEENPELAAFVKNTPLPARPVISGLKSLILIGFGCDSSELEVKLQNLIILTVCSRISLRKVNVVAGGGVPEALETFFQVENATVALNLGDDLKLSAVMWPLTSLTLYPDERGIRSLFGIAEIFQGTLTSLTISKSLGVVPGADVSMDFRVELPRLQHLQIPQIVSFDIFGNLGSLQVLTVFNAKWLNTESKAEFLGAVERELERSRSWKLLPKLRQVLLKGTLVNGAGNDDIDFLHALYRGPNQTSKSRFDLARKHLFI